MPRWPHVFAALVLGACSSTSTNEGSGGSSSGGAAGASSGGTAGSAGVSSGGASGGTTSSGGGDGGPVSCTWEDCESLVLMSPCASAWESCKGAIGDCEAKTKQYLGCTCKGSSGCTVPLNPTALPFLSCVAKDPALAKTCMNRPCTEPGGICVIGVSDFLCCQGTACLGGKCQ